MGSESIRNVALIGHSGAGKTSLAEAMLFIMGAVDRLGRVEEGNTASDYQKDEIERQFSIAATPLFGTYSGCKINLIDTPGFPDFTTEVRGTLRVADSALLVVDALTGAEIGSELTWRYAQERDVPRALVINRLDKEHASFDQALESAISLFGSGVIPLQFPLDEGVGFSKIVDLILNKMLVYQSGQPKAKVEAIPAEVQDRARKMRKALMETIAENDEALVDLFCSQGEKLNDEQLLEGLKKGFISGNLFPVICAAAYVPIGVDRLLDLISSVFPAPLQRPPVVGVRPDSTEEIKRTVSDESTTAFVFKTVSEQHLGELSFFRVFSGEVRAGSDIFNATQKNTEKVGQLY
ncbi:MAG: GTP-binding protein, partial [bacterium]